MFGGTVGGRKGRGAEGECEVDDLGVSSEFRRSRRCSLRKDRSHCGQSRLRIRRALRSFVLKD